MEGKEFKERFKVGDLLTNFDWKAGPETNYNPFSEIVYISPDGEEVAFFDEEDGLYCASTDDDSWEIYQAPKKKDLAGVKKYYRINKRRNGETTVTKVYMNDQRLETLVKNGVTIEWLTEQETIDRGLEV